ncbi:hypothetical protein [Bradyrhizobium nitroreducens]|uniref:hypothetical protein n=1 Tax=Bradyrhizobium nitroreducens TaxID=709803 RepID=UPI0011AE8831|nr:hypothetical protein [Bradyrhizobium nitroreducens]
MQLSAAWRTILKEGDMSFTRQNALELGGNADPILRHSRGVLLKKARAFIVATARISVFRQAD